MYLVKAEMNPCRNGVVPSTEPGVTGAEIPVVFGLPSLLC